MPLRRISGSEYGENGRRREHIDYDRARPALARVVARGRPAQQRTVMHRPGAVFQRDKCAIGQIADAAAMAALASIIQAFGVQDRIHLGCARRNTKFSGVHPVIGEGLRVFAAALETWPVPSRKRRHFIEEKQFSVTPAPDLALAVVEFQPAANPGARHMAACAKSAVVAMKFAAAITEA